MKGIKFKERCQWTRYEINEPVSPPLQIAASAGKDGDTAVAAEEQIDLLPDDLLAGIRIQF